jgi:hypothetical protein
MSELRSRIEASQQLLITLDGLKSSNQMSESQQQRYAQQAKTLTDKNRLLEDQLKSQQVTAETYDRQFQDLINASPKKPFLGLRTVQDWVLTGFFFSCLVLVVCVALYAGQLYGGGSTIGIVFAAGIVLIIMTGVLLLQVA